MHSRLSVTVTKLFLFKMRNLRVCWAVSHLQGHIRAGSSDTPPPPSPATGHLTPHPSHSLEGLQLLSPPNPHPTQPPYLGSFGPDRV